MTASWQENYWQVMQAIPSDVKLIAVSKKQAHAAIEALYDCGQRAFGENYLQEALLKQKQLAHLAEIEWHFIGHIQSNKTKLIAENFQWVQTVDRLSIAERLHQQRPDTLPPLNVCLQVNIDDEASKSGVCADQVAQLAKQIQSLSRLKLRGLMTIPKNTSDVSQQLVSFQKMKHLYDELNQKQNHWDVLSMGMSQDFQTAISAGSTMVRIGTKLFGERR